MGGREESAVPMDVKNYAWGRRMFESNPDFIQNDDGSRSTHLMGTFEKDGDYYAAPTVVQTPNGLVNMNPFDAFQWNLARGEAVNFGHDKKRAESFAEGAYKQGSPLYDVIDALTRLLITK
jgi:hypothetical protein